MRDSLDEVLHHALIEVLSTQMSVAVCRQDLKHAIVNCQQSNIKGSTTEIEHEDVLFAVLLVKTVGDGSSSSIRQKLKFKCILLYNKITLNQLTHGSLMIRMTLRPAIEPASFVAWRCISLKYAGTVTTACVTVFPR